MTAAASGRVIWLTGLSGAGKTTIGRAIVDSLGGARSGVMMIDGEAVRTLFGNDLTYEEAQRVIQIKRIQRLAAFASEQGIAAVVAALYAHPDLLAWNRANLPGYFEIYIEAPLELLVRRDSKRLYVEAMRGEVTHVVGIDIPWRAPLAPDFVVDVTKDEPAEAVAVRIVAAIPTLASGSGRAP